MARKRLAKTRRNVAETRFTVRVESHDGPASEAALEKAMTSAGFSRHIGPESNRVLLPQSEYRFLADQSRGDVRDLVRKIALKIGAPCSILVTQGACSWSNLSRPTEE